MAAVAILTMSIMSKCQRRRTSGSVWYCDIYTISGGWPWSDLAHNLAPFMWVFKSVIALWDQVISLNTCKSSGQAAFPDSFYAALTFVLRWVNHFSFRTACHLMPSFGANSSDFWTAVLALFVSSDWRNTDPLVYILSYLLLIAVFWH